MNWRWTPVGGRSIDFQLGRTLQYGTYELFRAGAGLQLQPTGALAGEPTDCNWLYTDGFGTRKYGLFAAIRSVAESEYWASRKAARSRNASTRRPDTATRAAAEVAITRMDVILLGHSTDATAPLMDTLRHGSPATGGGPGGAAGNDGQEPPTGSVYVVIGGLVSFLSRRMKFAA